MSRHSKVDEPSVLHVVYNLIRGGTEGQCARMAIEFARSGQRHRVAAFRREGFFLESVEQVCGPVLEINIRRMLSLDTFRLVRRLKQFIMENRFDLVHCWDADACIFGSVAARWARVPFITSHRDLGQIYPEYKLRLMDWADRRAVAVAVNAEAIKEMVVRRGVPVSRIHKLPNAVDVEEYDRLSAQPFVLQHRLPDGPLIGCVARFDPEKDIATLLRAAALLQDRAPNARFVVVGDGRERQSLERLAADLGVAERVVFLGEVNEIAPLLRQLAVGVLVPNANEGLSNTILEYMCAGIPVVATDCGGNRELVHHGESGIVVEPGHPQQLADALVQLLNDADQRRQMGAAGRRRVESNFAVAAVVEQFRAFYRMSLA